MKKIKLKKEKKVKEKKKKTSIWRIILGLILIGGIFVVSIILAFTLYIVVISPDFEKEALSKYLSGIVDCTVTTNGYSKQFMAELKNLADQVYPLVTNKYKPDYSKNNKFADENQENNFSNSMNSTLAKMKDSMK